MAKRKPRRVLGLTKQQWVYARRARKAGVPRGWSSKIIRAAEKQDIPYSLGFAFVETETDFKNVYGHDPVSNPVKSPPGGLLKVTRRNYARYKRYRQAGLGMQGVGPGQLTWWTYQDLADQRGGCWKVGPNLDVSFEIVHDNIARLGWTAGIKAYNGSGPAADAYAEHVKARYHHYRHVLTGK